VIAALRVLGGILLAVGVLGLGAVGFTAYQNARVGEYDICQQRVLTDGLPREVLPEAQPSGDFSWFPIGTACTWRTINSTTVVTHGSDWTPTFVIYGMLAGGVAGLVLLRIASVRGTPTSRRLAL
jgi:hypothetical protein